MTGSKPLTGTIPGRLRGAVVAGIVLGSAMGLASSPVGAAQNDPRVFEDSGAWDLVFEAANHRCRLNLRPEGANPGYAFAMPAGCRHAFPLLATARAWMPGEGGHLLFVTETGQAVLDFGPTGGPDLSAMASEQDLYTLTPTDQARRDALSAPKQEPAGDVAVADPLAAPDEPAAKKQRKGSAPAKVAAVAAAPLRQMSVAEVAGRYAVMRSGKDTGCMVTLDDGRAGGLKARLAPACRDQGIVVFDPAGWQLARDRLVLTAKRGHTADLTLQEDGTWATSPAKGKPLVLKRL